ncbi:MAG: HAMP domain-containing histidine kinase [Chitinophagales bacterium]|nr:HAMP domain-containing histidine kinase [Chitinophagales bacterium]
MSDKRAKDLYLLRKSWRMLLMICAFATMLFSLAFTYYLAREIEKDEKARVGEMAAAYKTLVSSSEGLEIEEALRMIQKNESIPVIWVSSNNELLDSKNIRDKDILEHQESLNAYLRKLKEKNQVVSFKVNDFELPQLLYYDASFLLKMVKLYPYLLFALVSVFLVLALVGLTISRQAEQKQLWVGMAKETAHQLGTPLSSLSAWVDYLEVKFEGTDDAFVVDELRKDVARLELVADRFSKIGSKPTLENRNVVELIRGIVNYMSSRATKSVAFNIYDHTDGDNFMMLNASLFEWVMENLIKNALDAMEGVGQINITIDIISGSLVIDVQDSGKGIAPNKIKSIFEPGFSTKKRGWGLGLTLSQRIIEQYHKGKIFVKESTIGKGTTFRIQFRKDIVE